MLLPAPECPTSATVCPAATSSEKFVSAGCELREPAVDHSTLSHHEGAMGGFRWLLVEAEMHRIKTARAKVEQGAAEGAVTPALS